MIKRAVLFPEEDGETAPFIGESEYTASLRWITPVPGMAWLPALLRDIGRDPPTSPYGLLLLAEEVRVSP